MKEKGLKLFFALGLLAALMVAAAAQEDGVGSDVEAFSSQWGAKVRLLQLESSITKNILGGNEIISRINQVNASADTSDIESILAELQALKEEISSIAPGSGEESAKNFVEIKSDAIELTKEFREKARELLTRDEAEGLRRRLGELNHEQLRILKANISDARKNYNANKVEGILTSAGLSNQGLVEQIRSGQKANMGEIKDYLHEALGNMSNQERRQTLLSMQESFSKGKVFVRAVADKVAYNRLERVMNRSQHRLDWAENRNMSGNVTEKIQKRIMRTEERMGRIENRTENLIEKVGNWTDRRIERLEDEAEKAQNKTEREQDRLEDRLMEGNLSEGQQNRVENRIEAEGNKSQKIQERLEDRIDKVENQGEKMMEKLGEAGGGPGKSGHGGEGE